MPVRRNSHVALAGAGRGSLNYDDIAADPFFEATVPLAAGPAGEPAVLVATADDGLTARSLADGAPGTWPRVGTGLGFPQSFGEVPPSPPCRRPPAHRRLGRHPHSDDGGRSFVTAVEPG